MLSVNSFGETIWIGPVKIVQILPHKVRVKFDNNQTRWIKQLKRLRPLEDFFLTGGGVCSRKCNGPQQ